MKDSFLVFWDTFDYDDLAEVFVGGEWFDIATSIPVIVFAVVVAALYVYKKTRPVGEYILNLGIFGGGAFVCLTALKNSDITRLGPLMLTLGMFLAASVWVIWKKLLN